MTEQAIETALSQLFGGGTAMAGFILVFLGIQLSAFASYETQQQASVRAKYKCRSIVLILGFVASLIAVLAAIFANFAHKELLMISGFCAFIISLLLALWAAIISVGDIG